MARAKSTDFLHNFRFHVLIQGFGAAGDPQLGTGEVKPSAGFNSVSTPEASHDAVEYREGHFIYTQKYVGIPTISDVSLSRGVALADGTFWSWMKDIIEGNGEYRATVSIYHFHRDSKPETSTQVGQPNVKQSIAAGQNDPGLIEYRCYQAFPIRHKVSSDLDATASEVSIQELDLAIENFEVIDHGSADA
jgi:phage tail-like protein